MARKNNKPIERSILFLLPPGFLSNGERQFCPECAEIWGFLHYYPAILEALDIRYEPLAHPRAGLVALLGEGRWNCPTLVLAEDAQGAADAAISIANGRHYIGNARDIARYFAEIHGTPVPR